MARSPDLSVVLASAHPGPALDALLARLLPQLADIRGELVFVDGSDEGLDAPEREGVTVQVLRRPGDDVFSMRAHGAGVARGWVVAFSEDHCMPADPHWAKQVLAAHVEHGDRPAVTGAVANGTTRTAWDRGSFLLTFTPVLDPMPPATALPRTPPPANVSVKREALDGYPVASGFFEFELLPHLYAAGSVATAPTIRMEHHQAASARWFITHHFHNGRTTGGLLRRGGGGRAVVRRFAESLGLTPRLVVESFREIRRRPRGARRVYLTGLPAMAVLVGAHACGQVVGALFGAGQSPRALE